MAVPLLLSGKRDLYMLDPVSKGEIEFAVIQKFEGADAESTSYAVGKNVSKCVYFLEISSALSVLAGGGGGSANSSGNIMLAGAGGEVYIVDGMELGSQMITLRDFICFMMNQL